MQQPDEQQWHEDDPHKLDKDQEYEHVIAALHRNVLRVVQGSPKSVQPENSAFTSKVRCE